jgi:hypothetical protein
VPPFSDKRRRPSICGASATLPGLAIGCIGMDLGARTRLRRRLNRSVQRQASVLFRLLSAGTERLLLALKFS